MKSLGQESQPVGASRHVSATGWVAQELRLGERTVGLIVLLLGLQLGLSGRANESLASFWMQLWVASMWAGWAIGVWILVRQPVRLRRAVALGALLGWHCLLMSGVRGEPADRYLIMLGSYGLLQSLGMTILRLPVWRLWCDTTSPARPRAQFNVFGIMLVTGGVAIVMMALRRYGPESADGFLSGTVLITGLMVSIASWGMWGGALRRGIWWSLLGLTLLATLAGVVATWAEAPASTVEFQLYWTAYTSIILMFGWMTWAAGFCGRRDANQQPVSQA